MLEAAAEYWWWLGKNVKPWELDERMPDWLRARIPLVDQIYNEVANEKARESS